MGNTTKYRKLTDTDSVEEVGRADEVLCVKNGAIVRAAVKEIRNAVVGQVRTANVLAASWSNAAPYTQNVQVTGVTEDDVLTIDLYIAAGTSAENVKSQNKAFGCLDRVVSKTGYIQLYCYNKKPTSNYTIMIGGL